MSGPSQMRTRQRMTSGTLTIVSPSKQDVQHAARVVAKGPQEICESEGCCCLQTLNLVAFERKERRLQARRKAPSRRSE